jgi:hypothetical protein
MRPTTAENEAARLWKQVTTVEKAGRFIRSRDAINWSHLFLARRDDQTARFISTVAFLH